MLNIIIIRHWENANKTTIDNTTHLVGDRGRNNSQDTKYLELHAILENSVAVPYQAKPYTYPLIIPFWSIYPREVNTGPLSSSYVNAYSVSIL